MDTGAPPRPNDPAPPEVMELHVPRHLYDIGSQPRAPPFRFWIDEVLWSQGRVAVELVDRVLAGAGGVRTGGPGRSEARAMTRLGGVLAGPLGSQNMDRWEVLWTKSTYAIPAARAMRHGQLLSAIIGLNSLTMKKRLMLTLREAYGPEGAFRITPRTFALPEELDKWAEWVAARRGPAASNSAPTGTGSGGKDAGGGSSSPSSVSPPPAWGGTGGDGGVRGDGCRGGGGCSTSGAGGELWILKTGQDAGKGLTLLPASRALQLAREQIRQQQHHHHHQPAGDGGGGGFDRPSRPRPVAFPLQVAQAYLEDPFLIRGRKFHLRLWVLVTGHRPLRAYLHRRGLVLFSTELYDKSAARVWVCPQSRPTIPPDAPSSPPSQPCSAEDKPLEHQYDLPASHVTNYARNSNTLVWGLSQLADYLGTEVYGTLWDKLRCACGRAVAAARSSLEQAHTWLQPTVEDYGFQMMGVDFLLDEQLHPWLLEFNSAPSIMVQHERDDLRQLVYEQKYGMLRDTWELVRGRVVTGDDSGSFGGASERVRSRHGRKSPAQQEAAAVKGVEYDPLMSYMPASQ